MAALLVVLAACSRPGEGEAVSASPPDVCAGLEDPVALAICRDADLKAMDADASRLYQRVLARASHNEQTALRAAYAEWQRRLADCARLEKEALRNCADALYNERIVDLQRRLRDLTG